MSISAPSVGSAGSRNAPLDAGGHVYVEKKACWRRKFLSEWEDQPTTSTFLDGLATVGEHHGRLVPELFPSNCR
ncbi:hypothetical protein ACI3LZ_003150 [Candidozyma auris]